VLCDAPAGREAPGELQNHYFLSAISEHTLAGASFGRHAKAATIWTHRSMTAIAGLFFLPMAGTFCIWQ